jgi:phage head maturation protease
MDDVNAAVRAAGMVTNPSGTERLHQYWVHGEGAAKIRWGEPNDFARCVEHLGKFIKDPQGYCNLAHHAALGIYPATHAAMEHAGRASVTTPAGNYDADGLDSSWDGDCSDLPDLTGLHVHHFEAAEQAMGAAPEAPAQRAMPKLGTGARFSKLKSSLAAKGAHDPGALAAYIGRRKFGKAKFAKIAAKARGKGGASRMSEDRPQRRELFRSYPLEDAHIVRTGEGDSTGRLVEAYCAVFDEAAEIHDHEGHYEEDIDRSAFNKRIADVQRSRSGFGLVKVVYNHGLTLHGTPAERFSLPVAVPKHISAESRGVLTRSLYMDTPLGNEVLEMWRSGAITAQSFTGAIIRSSPELRRGEKHRPRGGQLTRVKRLELGLKEYGPTPFPAYSGAELVGVRMSPLGTWQAAGGDDEEYEEQALPPDGEAAAGEPLTSDGEHSARYHQHALYRLRSQKLREEAGLDW